MLIRGNHDDKNLQASLSPLFEDILYQARIIIDGRTVYLNHFPFLCFAHWNPEKYDFKSLSFALNGHLHTRKNDTGFDSQFLKNFLPTQYEVGVDMNNFTPISWEEVNRRITYQIENNCNLSHWLEDEC